MFSDLVSLHAADLGAAALLLIAAFWLRYTARRNRFTVDEKRDDAKGAPPTFPYVFPLLGSLPVAYLWNPRAFVLNPNNFFQSARPVRVKILTQEFYTICGPENVKAFFRGSGACTSIPFVKFALGYAFGLPSKALSLYHKDDSGGGHVPHPGSTVEARNRIDYRVNQSLVRFLEGKGLMPFWNRFADDITQRLGGLYDRIGSDWEYHADLMEAVRDEATVSILNALCGPYLLGLNPHFLQDYWDFDRNLQTYLQGIPWFLAPRAYAVRKRVLDAVKIWQRHARDHYDDSAIDADGDDPLWGSSFFRERHDMFLEMDGFDYSAIASQDFGAIWATRNSITAASWAIFEIFRDPELLASIRAEVGACTVTSADGRIRFNVDQLLRLPILQAVYAETLRLRMDFYLIRMPDKVDMNIQDWVIPRRKVIVTPTTVAHMDTKTWSTGLNNEHPVDQFWIGRFLKYPPESEHNVNTLPRVPASPTFSTKEFEGSWIPYGGGPRQCPGRHFAKRQILLTTALMVSLFDCEISEEGKNVQGDSTLKGFGSGVSLPDGKVPVKIRRRDGGSM
ncbi:cytochrome P450 [Annulohypoxylon truncatum]|uniref:cytochrome P450 n=1 Tax=Annulohypoxylon truncatum TaxID=327061 RepID=UPI002008CE5E|nr:cytochrome P450 [Annulohypoxylon truncatum]KAI1210070.1 cytochrome P450 [Annulohypoxylon truncatum]